VLLLWTIRFTANGATAVEASSVVSSWSHSSSCESGRAFRDGNEPMTPARHWASTSLGCEMRKSGAPTTGMRNRSANGSGGRMGS
jgi:hypothetical protein